MFLTELIIIKISQVLKNMSKMTQITNNLFIRVHNHINNHLKKALQIVNKNQLETEKIKGKN